LRIDLIKPVDRRHQEACPDPGILEHQFAVGLGMEAGPRPDSAVPEFEPAPAFLVARHDLGDEIALLDARPEFRVAERLVLEQARQAEKNERELDGRKGHDAPLLHCFRSRSV